MQKKSTRLALFASLCLAMVPACDSASSDEGESEHEEHGDHEGETGDDHGETEIISTIELTFTPEGGGDAVVAKFEDPDGDGGVSGTSDPIDLAAGTTYTLGIRFLNELETPAEDITEEIKEEAEEHFVLFGGDAPVTHAYADVESDYAENAVGDDLPVGVASTITTDAAGNGDFRVMLRHLPDLNGTPQKSADIPQMFADGESLPGDVDVDVSFELTVQ